MRVHVCACVWSGKYRHVSCNDNHVPADAIRCLASRPTLRSEIIYRGIGNESRELYISTRASAGNAIWR